MNGPTLAAALTAFCDLLRAGTGAEVSLGAPDPATSGVFVWPWRLAEEQHSRTAPPAAGTLRTSAEQTRPSHQVQVLVLARPALTIPGLETLGAVRQAILDHPVLDLAGLPVEVALDSLDASQLATLFTAAGIPLTLCVGARLRGLR